jgi:sigma-B regulation protein RsbU (phosphoserine phosphatase)
MGQVLLVALSLRILIAIVDGVAGHAVVPDTIGLVVALAVGVSLTWVLWRLAAIARRRLLWRVRRKLILSYIFIGVVPTLLVVAFFLFAGFLMFLNVSAFLFKRGVDDIVEEARLIAKTSAIEIQRGRGIGEAQDVLQRKLSNNLARYAGLSLAFVPRQSASKSRPISASAVGPWRHDTAPDSVPEWVSVGGFGGLLVYHDAEDPAEEHLVIRAVGFPDEREPSWGIIADVPVDVQVIAQLRDATGIELQNVTPLASEGAEPRVATARESETAPMVNRQATAAGSRWSFNSLTIFDHVDWSTGAKGTLLMAIRVSLGEIYDRISAAQSRVRNVSLGELFMLVLGAIAVLFLIIEFVAFIMGFALARSITGSIHQLFVGTEQVRVGDFSHRINIRTRDQLGELAESFNEMTSSIETLLRQAEEKKRLEEELRIAREIQMSLLPRGPLQFPGLAVTALCVPAREVGGDYYDFFPLSDWQLGILIADVAGKGTSAALYMAELKGLLLSLSKIHHSPRRLLIEVNRIISSHLDSRSFITMTYAVVDLRRRMLTYARAGHTPLIYLPADSGSPRESQVLTPDGLVLGLRIEGVAAKFEQLLEEATLPLNVGDVFVLFTDGVTEAMNPSADLFGEFRLQQLVEEHGDLPTDELRERILREVDAFVAGADQHDDMTLILIKVEAQPVGRFAEVTSQAVVGHAS